MLKENEPYVSYNPEQKSYNINWNYVIAGTAIGAVTLVGVCLAFPPSCPFAVSAVAVTAVGL